jgi:hypothetical protein
VGTLPTGILVIFLIHNFAIGWVCFAPSFRVSPIRIVWRGKHRWVICMVNFAAFQNIHGLAVFFVADTIAIVASGCYDKI